MQEFEHYNQRKEKERGEQDTDGGQQIPTDPFAEQLLVSTQNADLKNASSRSVILAPFNSTISDEQLIKSQRQEIKVLLQPRRVIRFNAKIREINRQYELNNNAELDNGVYHQDGDGGEDGEGTINNLGHDGGLPTNQENLQQKSLATSFGKE